MKYIKLFENFDKNKAMNFYFAEKVYNEYILDRERLLMDEPVKKKSVIKKKKELVVLE